MKKVFKFLAVSAVVIVVLVAATLVYFSVTGSSDYQGGTTNPGQAVQGENTQKEESHTSEPQEKETQKSDPQEKETDKSEAQEVEIVQQGVSSGHTAVTQKDTVAKPEETTKKAEDNEPVKHISFTKKNTDPTSKVVDFDTITAKYGKVIEAVEKGYKNFQSPIDLSMFSITYDELRAVIKYLSIGHGYYYVKSGYNYATTGDYVAEYSPEYFFDAQEIKKVDKQINDEASRIASEAAQMKTDLEKFLYIHNSLIINITYGAENTDRDNNLYGAFVLKNTLCTGYSEAFCLIAEKLGLKSWVVTSDKLEHAWNIVLLNGRYYFVDCAWDDPTITNPSLINNPVSGYGRYQYFMCSEDYLYKNDHNSKDWVVNGISVSGLATSKFYDNFFWREYETLMKPSLGSWYQNYSYQIKNVKPDQVKFSIDRIVFSNNENYTIDLNRTIYACWKIDSSYYQIFYSTLQSYNGGVYYIKSDGIYKINENGSYDGSKDTCVFKNPRNDNIYDFCIDKANKTFTVVYGKTMDNNSSNATTIKYNISDYKF